MSEALSRTLETVGHALEVALVEAEGELADTRERCWWLESEIRSLRVAVRPLPPEVNALLSAHEDAPTPVPAPVADPPTVSDARPQAGGSTADYVPMLEELWDIARREGSTQDA